MTCREIAEFLMAYLDADLSHEVRAEFERHLRLCPPCVNYLRGYATTVALTKAAYAEGCEKPPEAPPELIKAILEARKKSSGSA